MNGARKYANLFSTGQYGKLYIVSGEHARGKTFRIFVIPKEEQAIFNGRNNPPLNKNAVEVYGVVSGNPGWTESYGWLYEGKWQEDFKRMVKERHEEISKALDKERDESRQKKLDEIERKRKLLEAY